MSEPKKNTLIIPPPGETFARKIHRYSFPPAAPPPWPWQATMICVVNCYLLWSLTWLEFLINFSVFDLAGRNLWFYTTTKLFGLTIPELFLGLSITLSILSLVAVTELTRNTPKRWKRIFALVIFSSIAIWFSILSLHLRHFSYGQALVSRERAFNEYHKTLTTDPLRKNDADENWIRWQKKTFERYDNQIKHYEEKYDLTPSRISLDK